MNKNRIGLACDKWGFELKEKVKKWLEEEKNAEVVFDAAPDLETLIPSPYQCGQICEAIQRDVCRHAITICGTGVGFAMLCNKYWGIRAASVSDMYTAERARKSQNAQILAIGAWNLAPEKAFKVISAWYDEPFDWNRASSTKNLKMFQEIDDHQIERPEWVKWSMGFSPEDQGEWYYPAK